jgi:hypothetical protein
MKSISGCVDTTITPDACDGISGSCTLTFYRAGSRLGITFTSVRISGVLLVVLLLLLLVLLLFLFVLYLVVQIFLVMVLL